MAKFSSVNSIQFNTDMFSSSRNDFKKEFNWINPWATSASKMSVSPLMNLPPLLFDWDKIPADYHHLRPPLYKNIKYEGTAETRRVSSAPIEFSIESLTRKTNIDNGNKNDESE